MSVLIVISRFNIYCIFFFFNDTATTEIYTLSLHDALPIYIVEKLFGDLGPRYAKRNGGYLRILKRSEEHTSELQSQSNFVCRLLLEKKKLRSSLLTYIVLINEFTFLPIISNEY